MDKTIKGLTEKKGIDGSRLRILIIHTRWNSLIVDKLVEGCYKTLIANKVKEENITIVDVPGAFELPFAAKQLMLKSFASPNPYHACIPIGVLIKGSTMHFEYIADATSHGIMKVGLDIGRPVIFGVLTCLSEAQALERAGVQTSDKPAHNHGIDWANAAIEMSSI